MELGDADADDSLASVIQRCELQISALAGRLDAESGRRSAVTRDISATVESQLLAVRSTVQGLAVLRAAVEEIGDELEDLGQYRSVTESHAVALDARVTAIARGVETQLGEAEQKVVQLESTVRVLQAELEAVRSAAPMRSEERGAGAGDEREIRDDAAARAEIASLRAALAEANVELARLGTALSRTEHGLDETRAEAERSRREASAARDAARAVADGVRDDVTAFRADIATTAEAGRAAQAEAEATVALLRADVATVRSLLDDASRAMDGMHGTVTAVGGDVGSLQEACEAAVRESSAVRETIAALRGESEERLAAATSELRSDVAGVRDATGRLEQDVGSVRGTVDRLSGEIETVRDTAGRLESELEVVRGAAGRLDDELGGVRGAVGRLDSSVEDVRGMVARLDGEIGAVRGASQDTCEEVHALRSEMRRTGEDLEAARGLIAILRDESLAGARAVETLRQALDGVREETRVATGALAAARDEMDLVHAGFERGQGETRALRDEVASLRTEAGSPVVTHAGAPEGLRQLTDAVEALRSGLARQDALVDARITTSHRATETLRGELTEMRTQMQEMLALMRERTTQPAASEEPLAALLETLGEQVASIRALAERMPGGRFLWAVVFPAPVLSVASALVRRFAPRPG